MNRSENPLYIGKPFFKTVGAKLRGVLSLSNRKQQEEDPMYNSLENPDAKHQNRKRKKKLAKEEAAKGRNIPTMNPPIWSSSNTPKHEDDFECSEKSETSDAFFDFSAPDSSEDSSTVDILPKQMEGCNICRLCDQPIPFSEWEGHKQQCVPITSGIQWYRNQ